MDPRKIGSIISFVLPLDWDSDENKYVEAKEKLEEFVDRSTVNLITEPWPEQLNLWPRWSTESNFAAIDLCCTITFYTQSDLSVLEKKLSGIDEFRIEDLNGLLFQGWYRRDTATNAFEYFDVEAENETANTRRYYEVTCLRRSVVQDRDCAMVWSQELEGRLRKRSYHFIVEKERTTGAQGVVGWNVRELHMVFWSTTENDEYVNKEFEQFTSSICWL